MSTLALVLIEESIKSIVAIVKHEESEMTFGTAPMIILGVAIVSKFSLMIACWLIAKKSYHMREALIVYRDDHRNDFLSNTTAFLGASLAY